MYKKKLANIMKHWFFVLIFFLFGLNTVLGQRTIEGTVKDESTGEPLPGVNITVKETTRGTASDADGNFNIEVMPEDETLVFSFVGYEEKEVTIGEEDQIEVLLSQKAQEMEEIVVVGYGTVKKSDLTGSVTSVKSESISKLSSANALDALAGKLSGAQISSSSGEPGSNPIVRVRGVGTINNANPIYVVDGVILDDISFLSSSDIESVELLKDASATAIYGSRGANGVFMVTTKSGEAERSSISFSSEIGIQQLQKKIDLLNGSEFARAYNDIIPDAINNPDAVDNVDWQDLIYRDNPLIQNYNLSISGGTKDLSYYFSGGVNDTKGIVPKSDYTRYNLKLNTEYQVRDYLNIGTKLSAAYVDDEIAPGVVETAYRAWPIDSPYDEDGEFAEVRGNGNPLAAIEYSNNSSDIYRLVSNMFAEFTFLEDFTFKTSYQVNFETNKNESFTPEYSVSPTQQNERSSLSKTFTEDRTWIFENTLTYENTIDDVHNINVLAGFTAQQNTLESPGVTVYDLIRNDPDFWYLNAATNDTLFDFGSSEFTNSMVSYIFRTNYSYKSKYLFTASLRADGSSKFAEGKRWGYFPSFALGWNIAREPFFPDIEGLEDVKIRTSWGRIGNEKIGWADRFALIGNAGAVFGYDESLQPGATYQGAGNSDIRWETTEQLNTGLEIKAFNNRLTTELEYYNKKTKDILVNLSVPGYYGVGSSQQVRFNAAEVLNKGLELSAQWREKKDNFNYSVNLNFSTVNNEVVSIDATTPSDSVIFGGALANGDQVTATYIGNSIGAFYGYETLGVFQNEEELDEMPTLSGQEAGDLIYKDVDGNDRINEDDKTIIGSPIPDYTFGLGFSAGYKGLNLSVDFQGQVGNDIYNAKNQTRFNVYNFEDRVKDRWTGENTSDSEPELDDQAGNYEPSDYFVEDGSYLRLRNITLSYEIPDHFLQSMGFRNAVLYLKADNLFTLTKYSGYSPDIGGDALNSGIDYGVYPITKSYAIGVNVTF